MPKQLFSYLQALILFSILLIAALPIRAHEAGYYSFQTPSQIPVDLNSLVMRATQIDVPAGAVFSLHVLKNNQLIGSSRTIFSTAYKNLFIFTGAAVATFRPLGTNEAPGDNFPGAKLYTGTADLTDIATTPGNYSFFWELTEGYIAPKDKFLATSTTSFSFVDLKLNAVAAASRQSDQKPGSVLFYHRYTSSPVNPQQSNTTLSLTNTSPTDSTKIRLFFVSSTDCQVFEQSACLASQQTINFSMSDYDPGTTGYCIAVACDNNGVPTQFNWLIGNAQIRQISSITNQPYDSSLSAIAVAKRTTGSVSVTGGKGEMAFNDDAYDRLPTQLAADNVPSQVGSGVNGNATVLSLYRPIPDLTGGSVNPKADFTAYNNNASSATVSQFLGCYSDLRLANLRFNPQLSTLIPSGKRGWIKIVANDSGPLIGAQFNSGSYASGASLRALAYAADYRISVPIKTPGC